MRYVRGEFPKMDFIKDDFIRMMQFIKSREESERGDDCQGNSTNLSLRITLSIPCTSILQLTRFDI